MMRILSLPVNFFREYSAGELANRSASVSMLSDLLFGIFVGTGLTSLTSVLYMTQILQYAPPLFMPSVLVLAVSVLFTVLTILMQITVSRKQL